MGEIIASTYEILGKLGSGGGGTAYLAYHNRLKKKVLLKADKRKVTTKPELLRREVDILKNLNHPNIPQVYDYFIEDDVVYTVMDFIEGESLDKTLLRERRFDQPTVINWSIQLLDALKYLHSETHGDPPKGYIHGDIKPSNIMLRPDGTICLIDFNISLALGERRIVGGSSGYASPEHYGLDYSLVSGNTTSNRENKTEALGRNNDGTEILDKSRTGEGTTGSVKKVIVPDVRSDIYSLGATFYHLLSGKKPERNAMDVVPLSNKEYSGQLVDIVSKAMMPCPELRFQSAEEMQEALLNIRDNDPRTKRLKHISAGTFAFTSALLAVGIVSSFTGLRRMQLTDQWKKTAEYAEDEFENGDTRQALKDILTVYPEKKNFLTPDPPSEAQRELTKILGVYDLSDKYKGVCTVELPSAVLSMRISPEGRTALCVVQGKLEIIDIEKGEVVKELPMNESALAEAEYADEDLIIYAGDEGIAAYSIKQNEILWQGSPATSVALSEDGKRAAGIFKDEAEAVLYQTEDGAVLRELDFGERHQEVTTNDRFMNPGHNLFELNNDGSSLAVSFDNGSLSMFDLDSGEELVLFPEGSGFTHFEGGFYKDYLAVSGSSLSESYFGIVDVDAQLQVFEFPVSESYYSVKTDRYGLYVHHNGRLERVDPDTGEEFPLTDAVYRIRSFAADQNHTAILTADGVQFFDTNLNVIPTNIKDLKGDYAVVYGDTAIVGSHDSPVVNILKLNTNERTEAGTYDAGFVHDEARVSADGNTIMLFSTTAFQIYNPDGSLVMEASIPDDSQIYDEQFRRQGAQSWLEVTYYDGTVTRYDASDGEVIDTVLKDAPDPELYEEFETSALRIESPLHGTPAAYSRDKGELVAELDPNGYLTYITETGGYIIAQYISTDGDYYGQLMNGKCEVLADLPFLSDIKDDQLIFDYPTGDIRKEKIFPLDDLIRLAKDSIN